MIDDIPASLQMLPNIGSMMAIGWLQSIGKFREKHKIVRKNIRIPNKKSKYFAVKAQNRPYESGPLHWDIVEASTCATK